MNVGAHGGGEAMCDHQTSPGLRLEAKAAKPVLLRPGVHGTGGFVQDDQGRSPEEGPRQSNPLPFAAAKFLSTEPLASIASKPPCSRRIGFHCSRILAALIKRAWSAGASISPKAMFSPTEAW